MINAQPPVNRVLPHEAIALNPELVKAGGLPDILLEHQKEVSRTMMTASVCFVEKSRRVGITWGLGSDAVLTAAASRKAGGMDVFYVGPALDMAREFIDVCASWARAFGQAASEVSEFMFKDGDDEKEIRAFRITFDSGFEILALTSRPRSLRGRQGFVIIDEAAFHDDLEAVMEAALALLMWGGKIVVLSTHYGADNKFNEYIKKIQAKELNYAHIKITFDDALANGFYNRVCLTKGWEWSQEAQDKYREKIIADYGKAAEQELFCIPSRSSGSYISGALVESRQVNSPVVRLKCDDDFVFKSEWDRTSTINAWCEVKLKPLLDDLDKKQRHVFGEDFGRNGDLTVIWPLALMPMNYKHTPFVVELRNCPFKQQQQILWYVLDRLPRLTRGAMDARGNGSQLAEETMQRYGADVVECVMISNKWYAEAVPPYKADLEDGAIDVPEDKLIVADHRAVAMANGIAFIPEKKTNEKGEDQRHADSFIAGVMARYAAALPQISYGYKAITKQPTSENPMRPDHSDDSGGRAPRFDKKGAF